MKCERIVSISVEAKDLKTNDHIFMIPTNRLNAKKIKSLYWNKDYNVREIAAKLGVSVWSLYTFMNKNSIDRRSPTEVNHISNKDKPRFKINEAIDVEEQKLKIAGIMLYWAEGTLMGCTVDFANSNPKMVQIFLKFLRIFVA